MHDSTRQGAAIGFFDGVHLGHQRILSNARVAITFHNHPLSVLAPDKAPRLIMTFGERERAIRDCGVEDVVALDFTPDFAELEPEEFARRFLSERTIFCGANWRFGKANRGDSALLDSLGYKTIVSPFAVFDGQRISSSRIRAAIEDARIEEANAMLGRPWRVTGRVVSGKGLGRTIGFPTVNLMLDELRLHLPTGVYIVEADGERAVANWGTAPTMREDAWTRNVLEVHFISSAPSQIPASMRIAFLKFLRHEQTFPDITSLKSQIASDISAARVYR